MAMTIWPVERPAAKSSGREAEGDHAMLDTFWDSRSLLTPLRDGLSRVLRESWSMGKPPVSCDKLMVLKTKRRNCF